jgi:putrescine aminotransferase
VTTPERPASRRAGPLRADATRLDGLDGLDGLARADPAHHLHPFTDPRVHARDGARLIVRGDGVWLEDATGHRVIDGLAGLWCVALGYGRAELAEAAAQQMRALAYAKTFFGQSSPVASELAGVLGDLAPDGLDVAFFASSGSEANETVARLVWRFWQLEGRPEKRVLLSRELAYHGSSVLAASLGGMASMHAMSGVAPDVEHVLPPYAYRHAADGEDPDAFGRRAADALDARIRALGSGRVAAFFAEPLQGAGGVLVPPASYWPRVQEICRRHDVLLVADEVITGFGRTGAWLGCQRFGIEPDLLVLAKALTSGYLPLSAVLVGRRVAERLADGGVLAHGYTHSGHPVACAVALENLRLLRDEHVIERVAAETGPYFQRKLRETFAGHPWVGEVRGVGLIGAVELSPDPARRARFEPEGSIGQRCLEHAWRAGLLFRAVRDSLCLCPPLVISEAEIDEMLARLAASLEATRREVASA